MFIIALVFAGIITLTSVRGAPISTAASSPQYLYTLNDRRHKQHVHGFCRDFGS